MSAKTQLESAVFNSKINVMRKILRMPASDETIQQRCTDLMSIISKLTDAEEHEDHFAAAFRFINANDSKIARSTDLLTSLSDFEAEYDNWFFRNLLHANSK